MSTRGQNSELLNVNAGGTYSYHTTSTKYKIKIYGFGGTLIMS